MQKYLSKWYIQVLAIHVLLTTTIKIYSTVSLNEFLMYLFLQDILHLLISKSPQH